MTIKTVKNIFIEPQDTGGFMKCQHSLFKNLTHYALMCTFIGLLSHQVYAKDNIRTNGFGDAKVVDLDTIRSQIAQQLQDAGPEAVIAYETYNQKFTDLLMTFLSFEDKKPIAHHIRGFDEALSEFEIKVVKNEKFSIARNMTEYLHKQFCTMVNIIRNAKSIQSLIDELVKYKHLLPSEINKRYSKIALVGRLHNRFKRR